MLKSLPMSKVINNFLTFQVGWLLSAYWHDTRALLVNIVLLFWLYHAEPWSKLRIQFTLLAAFLGVINDSALSYFGVISFLDSWLLPGWFILLWLLFTCTLSVSLSWLLKNKLLSAIGGAIFGPLAYWSGAQFSALTVESNFSYLYISASWLVLMVVFSFLFQRKPINRLYMNSADTSQ